MLTRPCARKNLAAVRVGIASHNLFDVAYGLVLARAAGVGERVQVRDARGMANHQRRALLEISRALLLYARPARKEEFIHAIGYLIRRLDENTGRRNFLSHAFKLRVGSPDWEHLESRFSRKSLAIAFPMPPGAPQNRADPLASRPPRSRPCTQFLRRDLTRHSGSDRGRGSRRVERDPVRAAQRIVRFAGRGDDRAPLALAETGPGTATDERGERVGRLVRGGHRKCRWRAIFAKPRSRCSRPGCRHAA